MRHRGSTSVDVLSRGSHVSEKKLDEPGYRQEKKTFDGRADVNQHVYFGIIIIIVINIIIIIVIFYLVILFSLVLFYSSFCTKWLHLDQLLYE